MTDQTVVHLVKRIAHCSAVIRQLETIAAAKLAVSTTHDVVELGVRMYQMDEVLVVESVRSPKAIPALCLFEKCRGRPSLNKVQHGLDRQKVPRLFVGENIF